MRGAELGLISGAAIRRPPKSYAGGVRHSSRPQTTRLVALAERLSQLSRRYPSQYLWVHHGAWRLVPPTPYLGRQVANDKQLSDLSNRTVRVDRVHIRRRNSDGYERDLEPLSKRVALVVLTVTAAPSDLSLLMQVTI